MKQTNQTSSPATQLTLSWRIGLPLSDDTALIAYSEFNLPGADGKPCKGIRVRTITTQGGAQ